MCDPQMRKELMNKISGNSHSSNKLFSILLVIPWDDVDEVEINWVSKASGHHAEPEYVLVPELKIKMK